MGHARGPGIKHLRAYMSNLGLGLLRQQLTRPGPVPAGPHEPGNVTLNLGAALVSWAGRRELLPRSGILARSTPGHADSWSEPP